MTTHVVATTNVVNEEGGNAGCCLYVRSVETLGDRLEGLVKEQGVSQREFGRRAGLDERHVGVIIGRFKKNPEASLDSPTLFALARAGNVRPEWLSTGQEPRRPDGAEATPPTPPARSQVRAKVAAERDDLEEIDGWFSETLQELTGGRRYTKDQVRAAKVFLATKGNPLVQGGSPRKLVLGALEAAKEIVELGREPEPDEIFTLLIEKNAPPSGPESGAREYEAAREFTQNLLAKEIKKAEREGFRPKKGRGK